MYENLIIVGVGGTGAKIVEAVTHLAASGNAPNKIFPILIDQDIVNGNVKQCRDIIKNYVKMYESTSKVDFDGKWAFTPQFEIVDDSLLPLQPNNDQVSVRAALHLAEMTEMEQKVVNALYTNVQLEEYLNHGYKKRAHLGSIFIEKLLKNEIEGLNDVIQTVQQRPEVLILICGSMFGGTGASGLINIGRYFKERIPKGIIRSAILTPYFKVAAQHDINDTGSDLITSDFDMQLIKVAIEMHQNELARTFNQVYFLGSDIDEVSSDLPTDKAYSGGELQKNPAHIFELLAATSVLEKPAGDSKYFKYLFPKIDGNQDQKDDEVTNCFFKLNINEGEQDCFPDTLSKTKMSLIRDFANMAAVVPWEKEGWKKKQPWISDIGLEELRSWAERHNSWWTEMASDNWIKFKYIDQVFSETYDLCVELSKNITTKTNSIVDTLASLNKIGI